MKKFFTGCILILAAVCAISCTTGSSISLSDTSVPDDAPVAIANVSVTVDHVPEKEIARQISLFAENCIMSANRAAETGQQPRILLDITVTQRSFLNGTKISNAVFMSFNFHTPQAEPVAVVSVYTTGKETVLSSITQQKYVKKAMAGFFSSQMRAQKK